MEKYTVCITYVKHDSVKTRSYLNLTIRQVDRLEKTYQRLQEKSLIKFLQFSKVINLYTVLLAYCKQGKVRTKAYHRLTENKVDRLRAIYQQAEKYSMINSLLFSKF